MDRHSNKLTALAQYSHNALGQRVIKVNEATSSSLHFVYDQQGRVMAEIDVATGATLREYIYVNGQQVALVDDTGSVNEAMYFVHNDHLGTPQRITDSAKALVCSADYEPFGRATVMWETVGNRLRYPGQYFDEETGLHQNGFRDYDTGSGRYLQSDPIGLAAGMNTYAYVKNNPLIYIDHYGLDILIITGGVREGSKNIFGYTGSAIQGYGMASYGNDTDLGSSVTDYLKSQSEARLQVVTLLPTSSLQDIMSVQYIGQHPDKNGVGLFDNCAVRNNGILNSAGIAARGIPFPGEFSRDVQSIPGAKTFIIPQNGAIPQGVLDVLPSFQSSPVE